MITQEIIKTRSHEITTLVSDEKWCQNSYIVRHASSSELILVDPGGDADRIIQTLMDQGANLKMILITHAHHDHVMALSRVYERFPVPCRVHKADQRLLRQAPMYSLVFGGRPLNPFTTFQPFQDEDTLTTHAQKIEILAVPGHTPGSVCYDFGDFVFTGDTLLYEHIGRSDTPGADAEQLKSSVGRLTKTLHPNTVVLPGHGRPWTIGQAQKWWETAEAAPPVYDRFGTI